MIVACKSPALTAGLMILGTTTPIAAEAADQCTSGWTGQITYSRKQALNNTESGKRTSDDGTETKTTTMASDYSAQVAVSAGAEPGESAGRATISAKTSLTETIAAIAQARCEHNGPLRTMTNNTTTTTLATAAGAGDADVAVSVDDDSGQYSVSLSLPEVEGTSSGSSAERLSGQCTPVPGKTQDFGKSPTSFSGLSFQSSGNDRVPSGDANQLSGQYAATNFGITETLGWNLRRCAGEIRLVDLKFEDMTFPTWNSWQPILAEKGTTDGNIVRVTAIVKNEGSKDENATIKFRDTYKGDKWDGAKPDGLLNELTVQVPAGQQREVRFSWDSSGYAWYDDGRPRLRQRIKAEVSRNGKAADELTRELKVAPKPLVLVHGISQDWHEWEAWQNILTTTHSYDWKAFPVGEKPENGVLQTGALGPVKTISENADQLGRYIDYAQKSRNAWHVDVVAFSIGGLISRRYIHASMPSYTDGKPQISRLMMLATPNNGNICADLMDSVSNIALHQSAEAYSELKFASVDQFNAVNINRKGVQFSAVGRTPGVLDPAPALACVIGPPEDVLSRESPVWKISDSMMLEVRRHEVTGTVVFSKFVLPHAARGPGKQVASVAPVAKP